jgi:hypothetical protein
MYSYKLKMLNKGGHNTNGPKQGATSYKGKIDKGGKGLDTVDANIFEGYEVTSTSSSGVAVLNGVFPVSHVTAITDFTEFQGLYQECRVLGMNIHWNPSCQNGAPPNSALNYATPWFFCPSHVDNTALTGDVQAFAHEGKRYGNFAKRLTATIRMAGPQESDWFSTASGTTSTLCIKTYLKINTISASSVINLGNIYVEYLVQFRGRVITDVGFRRDFVRPGKAIGRSCVPINFVGLDGYPEALKSVNKTQTISQLSQKSGDRKEEKDSKCESVFVPQTTIDFVTIPKNDYTKLLLCKKEDTDSCNASYQSLTTGTPFKQKQ